jgi:hypothetical protein
MIDTTLGWTFLKYPIPFLDELYAASRSSDYIITRNGLFRAKADPALEKKICDFYELPLDVGFYKAPPGWSYKLHADNTRNCAFNQLLCDNNPGYISKMRFGSTELDIPYSSDQCCVINTALMHNISNTTTDSTRYLLNIGVKEFITYESVITHLKSKGMV